MEKVCWRRLYHVLRGNALNMQTSRKVNTSTVCENVHGRRCGRILLSKAGYVTHWKSRERRSVHTSFSQETDYETCPMCNKVYKSVSHLKKHTVGHKYQIPQPDPVNLVGRVTFASEFVDMQHLSGHERWGADGGNWDYVGRHCSVRDYAVATYVCMYVCTWLCVYGLPKELLVERFWSAIK